ncbi:GNAT family N-acetyltransferase [Vibrio nomapromontoriensis]|uniref:GNAT family N-acetyltransferase n=1 Tax=Vibrio nomapromontoriensis TaxID=2910246 RepID=UPI003D15319F
MLDVRRCSGSCVPIELLLEADPDRKVIESYRNDCTAFVISDGEHSQENNNQTVAVLLIFIGVNGNKKHAELYNISVAPNWQKRGLGSQLLSTALECMAKEGVTRVELGTGTFGYQLTFYQRHGFRVDRVVKDFFLDHYPQAIIESGIQHKDMLRLVWFAPGHISK